jgi:hypothetical protein
MSVFLTSKPAQVFSLAKAEENAAILQKDEEDDWVWKVTPIGDGTRAIVECFEPDGYKIGQLTEF